MLSRAGTLVISLTAVVVVGRYDTLALGQLALGTGVFLPMAVAGIGMMTGLLSVVSAARARARRTCRTMDCGASAGGPDRGIGAFLSSPARPS